MTTFQTAEEYNAAVIQLGNRAAAGMTREEGETALAALAAAEQDSRIFLPFSHARAVYALSTADALLAAVCLTHPSEPRLLERWQEWGGTELPGLFTVREGGAALWQSVRDFLLDREPLLPRGGRLEFAGEAVIYHDQALLERLTAFLASAQTGKIGAAALLLWGEAGCGKKFLFGQAARARGCGLLVISSEAVPSALEELMTAARLYNAVLCCDGVPGEALSCALAGCARLLFIAAQHPSELSGWVTICREIPPLSVDCQRAALLQETGDAALAEQLAVRRLTIGKICGLARRLELEKAFDGAARGAQAFYAEPPPAGTDELRTNKRLSDLVLPEEQTKLLARICAFARSRDTVYHTWRFARKVPYGRGISVLFYGASGTGKTLAASALARELELPCYRADLAQMVSKYIGETQKNIGMVFDEAARRDCVLFFDEADALFARRGDGQDAGDAHRNGEIAYLLQRMENYEGIAILATNLLQNFDEAFRRRITYMVHFPLPDAGLRERLWREMFPPEAPLDTLDWGRLAGFELSGASIKNCALHAAYLAAAEGGKISMARLTEAVAAEYQKNGKSLPAGARAYWT